MDRIDVLRFKRDGEINRKGDQEPIYEPIHEPMDVDEQVFYINGRNA